jgi:hypothetical protein
LLPLLTSCPQNDESRESYKLQFHFADGKLNNSIFTPGTTWTQQIIHQLLRSGAAGGSYGETVPWLEATASDFLQPREAPTWTLDKINNAPTGVPRYFKTHATVSHLPRGSANIKGTSSANFYLSFVIQ